jgi:phenylpyruvate tautomerase
MPLLNLTINQPLDADRQQNLLRAASSLTASILGKPETYVLVQLQHNPAMLFAGNDAPLAYLELKSINLPEQRTAELSAALCDLLEQQLEIPPQRVYIEFSNAQRHLWGWNKATF